MVVPPIRMFQPMWDKLNSGTSLIRIAKESLEHRLPPGWLLLRYASELCESTAGAYADCILEVKSPEGVSAFVVLEVKKRPLEAREVHGIAEVWRRRRVPREQYPKFGETGLNLMVVSPYLGPSTRDRLTDAGISFVDQTGNLRFTLRRPAVFIETQGANSNPWREKAPLHSLKGRGTGRVLRAFLDYRPPYGVRQLADVSRSPAASVSRVANLLQREAVVSRGTSRGPILIVEWERLLRRWALDYDFVRSNNVKAWLEPRGTRTLLEKLHNASFRYAVTGSFAAIRYAPIAEPRLVAMYADDPDDAAKSLGLHPGETGGNVLIGEPFDNVVFERTTPSEGVQYVRVTQVAIDLLTGPGRNPAEAESLIEWMRHHEDEWKIPLTLGM